MDRGRKRCEQGVCRIIRRDKQAGSGSLVLWKEALCILTNNHVFDEPISTEEAEVSFRWMNPDLEQPEYLNKKNTPLVVMLDPSALFATSPELDFTLVAVAKASLNAIKCIVPAELSKAIPRQGCPVKLCGHPNGSRDQYWSEGADGIVMSSYWNK